MIHVHACLPVAVPADRVWAVVGAFDSLAAWHPGVASSGVEGQGAGAIRTVVLHEGGRITERLAAWEPEDRRYEYQLLKGILPLTGHRARVAVTETGPGASCVHWSARFNAADGADADGLAALMAEIFATGLQGIAARLD